MVVSKSADGSAACASSWPNTNGMTDPAGRLTTCFGEGYISSSSVPGKSLPLIVGLIGEKP